MKVRVKGGREVQSVFLLCFLETRRQFLHCATMRDDVPTRAVHSLDPNTVHVLRPQQKPNSALRRRSPHCSGGGGGPGLGRRRSAIMADAASSLTRPTWSMYAQGLLQWYAT